MTVPISRDNSQAQYEKYDDSTQREIDAVMECEKGEVLGVSEDGYLERKKFTGIFSGIKKIYYQWTHAKEIEQATNKFFGKIDTRHLPPKSEGEGSVEKVKTVQIEFFTKLAEKKKLLEAQGALKAGKIELKTEVTNLISPSVKGAKITQDMVSGFLGESAAGACRLFSNLLADAASWERFKRNPENREYIANRATDEEYQSITETILPKIVKNNFSPQQIQTTHDRVKQLSEALRIGSEIKPEDRLNYDDLRMIDGAYFIRKSAGGAIDYLKPEDAGACSLELRQMDNIAKMFEASKELKESFTEGYKTGDVLFYDLAAKQRFGDNVARTQMLYDRYSHVGLYAASDTGQDPGRVFHAIPTANVEKIKSPVRMVFLPRKEVDLSKVFSGYEHLKTEEQQQIRDLYETKIKDKMANPGQYKLEIPSTMGTIRLTTTQFLFSRTPQISPATIARRAEGGAQNVQNATNAMLCSGFVAGVIYETMKEIQEKWNADEKNSSSHIELKPEFKLDVTNMTPKNMKKWNIWQPAPAGKNFSRIVTPEVLSGWKGLHP